MALTVGGQLPIALGAGDAIVMSREFPAHPVAFRRGGTAQRGRSPFAYFVFTQHGMNDGALSGSDVGIKLFAALLLFLFGR